MHELKRDYIYIAIILLALGAGIFGTVKYGKENRELRKDNKEYQKQVKAHQLKVDSLGNEISKRNEVIEQSTLVVDSLKLTLEDLNKNIVPKYAPFSVVNALDLNGQIQLLANYLSQADSLAR